MTSALSVMESSDTIFKTCGVQIPLTNIEPESVKIVHAIPKSSARQSDSTSYDFTVKTGEKIMKAHKDVLRDRIPFFKALFNSRMEECEKGEIKLSSKYCEFDLKVIENLLNYANTGKLTITVANVQSLMMGAIYFQMDPIVDECARFLRRRLTLENVLPILFFCRSIVYNKIDEYIFQCIDKHFVSLSRKPEFIILTEKDVSRIILRKSLHIEHNKQIIDAIYEWFMGEPDRKQEYENNSDAAVLINERREHFATMPAGHSNCACTDISQVCYDSHRLIGVIETDQTLPRGDGIVVIDQKIYFFGGWYLHQFYDTVTNEWDTMPKMPKRKYLFSTGVVGGRVYIIGGLEGTTPTPATECYNPSTREWASVAACPGEAHVDAASCVLNGCIYVFGGRIRNLFYRRNNRYNPATNSWARLALMTHFRCAAAAAALGGQIYVVGGYNGRSLDVVERYNPATNSWTTMRSMITKRVGASLVVSCGKLFAVGGYTYSANHKFAISSIEMYSPEADTWEEITCVPDQCYSIIATTIASAFDPSHSAGFSSFLLKEELNEAIADHGFTHPSRIQHELIPQAARGMDVNCQARSGLGKTSIFILATLEQLVPVDGVVSALVLCPTQEMAKHIDLMYATLSKDLTEIVKTTAFCGEARAKKNRGILRNNCPHIAIGTPGRILSLVMSGALKLDKIKHLILDECDRMFENRDMKTAIETIFKFTPDKKQVMMFSTTLPKEMHSVCRKFIKDTDLDVEDDCEQLKEDFCLFSMESKNT